MAQLANCEYFWKKCNQQLNTNYTGTSKQVINIEWLIAATKKVYNDIHKPLTTCSLLLSSVFDSSDSKIVANVIIVDKIIEYLKVFNKPCIVSECNCDCGEHWNCNC